MSQSVEAFALLILQNEQRAAATLTSPVLLWSITRDGKDTGEGSEHVFGTMTGGMTRNRPREGEAMFFQIRKSPGSGNPFAMGVTVGRADNNDVPVPDGSVSRFHAYFQQDPRTLLWKIVDADSKNGTWLGPLKLTSGTQYPVNDGARLRFGDVEMVFWTEQSFMTFVKNQLEGTDV